MREQLKQEAIALLENYLEDLRYWCAVHEVDGINFVTAGTPSFDTLEDANAYRVMVKAVLKEMRGA
jgi:hypothetical protein